MDISMQVWLGLTCLIWGVSCLEVGIPERFLKPRDYNPHAYTGTSSQEDDLGPIDLNSLPHPYALFVRPPVHRGESSTAPIQFPKVPDSPTPNSQQPPQSSPLRIKPQRIPITDDLSHILTKNYAFSYKVQDHGSGDDFSHSQAHKGGATKGEYRVKLPDGRVQIVSYTADNSGYRADVRYDSDNSVEGYQGQVAVDGYNGQQLAQPTPISRPQIVNNIKTYTSKPAYDELINVPQYIQSIEPEDYQDLGDNKDYLSQQLPVRYLVSDGDKQIAYDGKQVVYDKQQVVYDKSGLGYVLERPRQDYTPIHEDYPDIPPPERNPPPPPPPPRAPVPGPTQAYILSPTPSPRPGYITPKPSLLYSSSPSPHKFVVLPHQVKPYEYQ